PPARDIRCATVSTARSNELPQVSRSSARAAAGSQLRCRSREIGLRMALGATAQNVLWMMLRRGGQIVAPGLLIGLVGAAAMTLATAGSLSHLIHNLSLKYRGS